VFFHILSRFFPIFEQFSHFEMCFTEGFVLKTAAESLKTSCLYHTFDKFNNFLDSTPSVDGVGIFIIYYLKMCMDSPLWLVVDFLSASILLIPMLLLIASLYYILLRATSGYKYFDILMFLGIAGLVVINAVRVHVAGFLGGKEARRKVVSVLHFSDTFSGVVVFLWSMTVHAIVTSSMAMFFESIPFPLNILLFTSMLVSAWIAIEDLIIATRSAGSRRDLLVSAAVAVFYITVGVVSFPVAIFFLLSITLLKKVEK